MLVRDTLKDLLHPTKIKFRKDGRVELTFDFSRHNPDHSGIFQPRVREKSKYPFRWSLHGYWEWSGLRVGDSGLAVLNCWFEDDVEAEISYRHQSESSKRPPVALVYVNKKKDAIGTNFGTECVVFRGGRTVKKNGEYRHIEYYGRSRKDIKLRVKDGTFEAHFRGRKKADMGYCEKKFKSGKIGFLWAGKVAGTISRLTITGKVDAKAMAKVLRSNRNRKK